MNKLLTTTKDTNGLSIGFDRGCGRRQREINDNKDQKGKYHVRNMLKNIFGFAQHHEKATFGLGYRLLLKRKTDNSVLNKANATVVGRYKINSIEWYVQHYAPSISQQTLISK